MSDLINRRVAIKAIADLPNCYNGFSDTYDKAYIIGVLEELPTVDAVPVVRCKDCKHRPTIDGEWENGFDVKFPDGRCPCQCDDGWYNWMPRDDWFCGNGERK